MTEGQVRKYVTYLAPLVIGAGLLGCGIGGCVQHDGPESRLPIEFANWPLVTQVDYLKDREEKRLRHELAPKSELSNPVVFGTLIAVGLVVGAFGVGVIMANELN